MVGAAGHILAAHFKTEAGGVPRQRRVREGRGRLHRVGGDVGQGEGLEVLHQREAGQYTTLDVTRDGLAVGALEGGLELTRAASGGHFGDQLARRIEGSLEGGLDERRGRNERLPLEGLRIDALGHSETVGIEHADAERLGLAGAQQHLVGDGLQLGGGAGLGPRGLGGCGGQAGIAARFAEGVELFVRLQIHLAVVAHGRTEDAAGDLGAADFLGAVGSGPQHEQVAIGHAVGVGRGRRRGILQGDVHAHVQQAIGIKGRALALFDADLLLPQHLARGRLDGSQVARAGDLIESVAHDNRRAGQRADAVAPLLEHFGSEDVRRGGVGGLNLRGSRDAEEGHAADFRRIQVLGFVQGHEVVFPSHQCGVNAALGTGLGEGESPERLAGPGVDGQNGTVATSAVEHALATPEVEPGLREGVVLRAVAGRARPDQFPGLLVEGVETVAGGTVGAPGAGDAAHDHQFMVDDRGGRARIREGQPAELLHHGVLPQQFALGRKGHKQALRVLGVDVARLGIHRRRRGRVAQVNRVAQEVALAVTPQFLAGLGVEAGRELLEVLAIALVAIDVQATARDHRRALARKVHAPERSLGIELLRQSFLGRHRSAQGATPGKPAIGGRQLQGQGDNTGKQGSN